MRMQARLAVLLLCVAGGRAAVIPNDGQFVLVGTHPDAVQQPSGSYCRHLRKLAGYDGKLYAGYGDEAYNNNEGSGPIALTPPAVTWT